MRTTIRLDDQLLTETKQLAARTGRTLTAVIEDALRQVLAQSDERRSSRPFKLTTFGRDGLQPGVDLDDSAALLDLMESDVDPR
jgi:hypothetical protein